MPAPKAPPILALIIVSILVLAAIALWDDKRESAAALDDFAAEQTSLAREAGAALVARLGAGTPKATPQGELLASVAPALVVLEERGSVVALVQRPGATTLSTPDGTAIGSPPIEGSFARGDPWVRLSRPEAAALGLPARMAIAGLATADAGTMGVWKIAIVTTARRVRDREARARWRLVLGFALVSALIAAFGAYAQRNQKKEVALARSLAIAEAMQARDERLVRADKLATLGALATGIAHEVSTPLGVIVGRAEQLLPRVATDERATLAVHAITEQAERITRIVRAFLRLARGGTPSLENVAPADLADSALELVEHRFAKAHVALTRRIAPGLPRIACDPKLFEQVLVNLLLNACDACKLDGHVELSVDAADDHVAFVVTDDGEGITADVAAHAIEPFFTTKSEEAGTGLGLAIANEIVKHHHGELTLAARQKGRGTSARVSLAAVRENDHG